MYDFSDANKKKKGWIAGAVKKPGALRAQAKKAGAIGPDGKIKASWLAKKAKGNSTTAKRARLAQTFKKMKKK